MCNMFIMHDLIASFISSIVHKLFLVRHISAFQFISCVNLIGSCFQIWCVCVCVYAMSLVPTKF